MRKIFLFVALMFSLFAAFGQKKGLNYQAVILDPNSIEVPGVAVAGQPLSNGKVWVKFTLKTSAGTDYEEIQQTKTDEFGLISLTVGTGTSTSSVISSSTSNIKYSTFDAVVWDAELKSLVVSVNFDGGTKYTEVSNQKLNYTPYALYAESVDYKNVTNSPKNLSQFNNDSGYLVPKDLDPLKSNIASNTKAIDENQKNNEGKFLVVNQTIEELDKKVKTDITTINNTLVDHNNRINVNATNLTNTANNLNSQIGSVRNLTEATANTVNNLGGTYEFAGNKSAATNLGGGNPSDVLFPTQRAAKSYVDNAINIAVATGAPDATTLASGKIQLSGDLGGTATNPTVPGLANKESLANKSTNVAADAGSDTKYPSVRAIKTYVDQATQGIALQAAVEAKADKNSPIFTGNPSMPSGTTAVTQSPGNNSTAIATTSFVQGAIASATIVDADANTKGKIQLTGDLGGTAGSPTVPALANKEDVSNKSTSTSLGNSNSLYPTQNAVKIYVDNQVAAATIADADANTKGKLQLAGDLTGTAASPAIAASAVTSAKIADGTIVTADIADNAITTAKVVDGAITNAKIADATILNAKFGEAVSIANGGTGATTATAALTALGAQSTANLSTDVSADAASVTKYPAVKTIKDYVDNSVAAATIADATTSLKGKIQLGGDLAGTGTTAAAPVISNDAITTVKILDANVTTAKLAANAVTTAKITDANVTTAKIADLNVTTGKLADDAVTTVKITDANITTAKIADANVITAKIADLNVTTGKLADDAVTSIKITDANVTTAKLAPNAITTAKVADGAITNAKIADATILNAKFGEAVSVANGGTGATTATAALTALGAQSTANLSTDISGDASSTSKYPAVKSIKDYVDASVVSATPDATTSVKGKIQLGGDLAGTGTTAAAPVITNDAITTVKILDANVTTAKLAANAVTTAKITDANVTTAKIADLNVTTGKLADDAVTTIKITDANITTAKLAANAVTTAKITDANVTTAKIADLNVTTGKLADDAVTTVKITDANVTNAKIADNAVTTAKITDANITTAKIAASAITTAKIADANVTTAKLADTTVTTAKIANGAITNTKIGETITIANGGTGATTAAAALTALGSQSSANLSTNMTTDAASLTKYPAVKTVKDYVDASVVAATPDATSSVKGKIQLGGDLAGTGSSAAAPIISDNAITTIKITDANITTAKLANDAVTTVKITDANVTTAKLADNAVTTVKITDANVTTAKIADANITTGKLADDAVTTVKITNANVTTAKIADNAITTAKITDANVTAAKLASNAVTTIKIADGNVTTAKLADTTVTTDKIANAAITNAKIGETITIANGGTGATTATAALTALGAQSTANLSTNVTTDAASLTKYPAVKTIKDYVDASITSGAPDADATTKGKIQLAGDLTGTAASPAIAASAVTTAKINDAAVTSAKIADGTIVNADINASAAIVDTKLATIATAGKVSNSATTADDANTASAIVARDASGNFAAGTITANLTGLASKATNINGGALGSIPYQSAANTTSLLAGNTSATKKFLTQTGDGTATAAPVWAGVAVSDITGTLPVANGGTGVTTAAANLVFAGPTSGATASAPSFRSLVAADLPAGSTNYVINGTTQQASTDFNISGSGTIGTTLDVTGNTTIGGTATITGATTLSALTASKGVFTDASKRLTSTGTLGTDQGGTGMTSFNSGGAMYATSTSALATGTLPTSAGGTGLTTYTSGGALYTTSTTAITSGTLPVSAGGTGSTTQNFVDLTTAQTIAGAKTFSSTIVGSISGNAATVTNGVYTTDKISVLAATTSAELAGVISNESGTGALVFATSPTLVTPTLGVASATSVAFAGSTSGTATISAPAVAGTSTAITLPAASGTLATLAGTETLTNKTLTSPTFTAPVLGIPASGTLTNATGLPLTTGVTGTLPLANGGTGQTTKAAAFDALSPMTTAGDIIYGGTSGTGTRLAKGTDGQVLTLASGVPSWASPAGVTTMAAIGSVPNANGASISGNTLTLQPADASNGGVITTATQTIAGAKTFSADLTVNGHRIGRGAAAVSTNIAIGPSALNSASTTGSQNIAIGSNTLKVATTGFSNVAIGNNTLAAATSGNYNTGVGSSALNALTEGMRNTALGNNALNVATTASDNVAIGHQTLQSSVDGGSNVAVGNGAGVRVTSGSSNVIIGSSSGIYLTTASNNVIIGPGSGGGTNTTGTNSVFVGRATGPAADGETNEVVIAGHDGSNSNFGLGSHTTKIGNSATTFTALMGDVGIGSTTDGGAFKLQVTGDTKLTGTLTLTGGTPGAGKVLISDANGLASWSANSNGGVSSITATATMAATDNYNLIVFSGSTASQVITLPSAATVGAGREITIKNIASVPVGVASTSGTLISDSTTTAATSLNIGIEPSNNWIKAISNGTNWIILRALF